jgi:hypothetical protein
LIHRDFAISCTNFKVGDEHTVYEWCMIYAGRHPGVASADPTVDGQKDRLEYLGAIAPIVAGPITVTLAEQDFKVDTRAHYRIANAVYQELVTGIRTGSLEPKRRSYLEDRPDELDPTLCVIGTDPILRIAERRGDGGSLIRTLLGAPHQPAEPPARVTATASQAPPPGIRTNRDATAEEECRQWLSGLTNRPANRDIAFEDAKTAVASIGRLSRKAFDRAWASSVPPDWKLGGSRKKTQ